MSALLAISIPALLCAGTAFGISRLGAEEDVAMLMSGGVGALCGMGAYFLGGVAE